MSKRLKILFVIMVVMLLGLGLLMISADGGWSDTFTFTYQEEGTIDCYLQPSTTTLEVGENFTLDIVTNNYDNIITAWVLYLLDYKPAGILNITNIDINDYWDMGYAEQGTYNNTIGELTNPGAFVTNGYTGITTLMTITFEAVSAGTVKINITDFQAQNKNAQYVNCNLDYQIITVPQQEYCGDGICNNGEDCSTCPEDCGECGGGNGGNGGNGGGGNGGGGDPGGNGEEDPPLPPNTPPVADGGGPYSAYVNETILFNGSGSYDVDNDSLSYFWIFSDGSNSTKMLINHIYTSPGNYTVKLTVTDDEGNFSDYYTYAIVTERPEEPDDTNETEPPDETDDNKTTPLKPTEINPMLFIGVILLVSFIILLILHLISKRKKND